MFQRMIFYAVLLGTLSFTGNAQEAEPNENKFREFDVDELHLVQYRPQYVHPSDLTMVVGRMLGRSLYVSGRGPGARPLQNLSELGGQIIIYDTKPYTARVLETLKTLDQPAKDAGVQVDLTRPAEVMVEYTARNVSVSSLSAALRSFGNLQYSEVGSRMVAARMAPERKQNFLEFMERVDQPDPCVLLTCYLLRAEDSSAGASGPQPPKDVTASLQAILPDLNFRSVGFSMVQSTVSEGREIQLGVDASDGKRYQLKFNPMAFDKKSGNMTVLNCELTGQGNEPNQAARGGVQFSGRELMLGTDTVFPGNQYTVLGASGKDPVFLVVHSRMIP